MQLGRTPLINAARRGHTATVQYLVKETSAQVNATDNVSHSNNGVFVAETAILFLYSCIINVSRVHNCCITVQSIATSRTAVVSHSMQPLMYGSMYVC